MISVWASTSSDGGERIGVVQWNIGSFSTPITSAVIELFDRGDSRSQSAGLTQLAFLIDPPEIVDYSYEEYSQLDQSTEIPLEALGFYDIEAPDTTPGYELSESATSADIALLESRRNGTGLVTLIFKATAGERDWGDIGFDGTPPRLYLNETPVVCAPGDWAPDPCDGVIDELDFAVLEANWLQTVEPGMLGDHNFDGTVNLEDFHLFKELYLAAGNAGTLVIPEPASLLLALAAVAASSARRLR